MFRINRILLVLGITAFLWMLAAPFITPVNLVNQGSINRPNKIAKLPVKIMKPEKPLHSVKLPDFSHIASVSEKKRQFFQFLTPAIRKENQKLLVMREKLLVLKAQSFESLMPADIALIKKLTKQYKVNKQLSFNEQLDELLRCVDQVPEALVLVQAANESAWGTSRFARIGLNFFGIWCYKPKCGMIPNGRSGNDRHEVAAFQSVAKAVHSYFYNINTHAAYKVFRHIRAQLRAENHPLYPEVLASGLLAYSSRGEHYVVEITKMIEQNQAYFTEQQIAQAD